MKIKYIVLLSICFWVWNTQAQIDRSKMPVPAEAPEINIETAKEFTLENGLSVLVVEDAKFPKVRASLLIDNEPVAYGEKVGVQSLYSAMMGNGTQSKSKETFNERIDFLGASVGYGSLTAYASSLSRFFPEVFELMVEGLLQPLLTQEEFDAQKERVMEALKADQNSASAIARKLSPALTYGMNHPYGEFPTLESVEKIQLSDVEDYYKKSISPRNAYLVVVGDIGFKEVEELVNRHLSQWPNTAVTEYAMPEVSELAQTEINFIDMSNAVQSEIGVINTVKLKKASPDYFAGLLANQILGGGGEGRLFNYLREEKGYTYGSYSSLGNDKYIARFRAEASVGNEVTDSAVVALLDEIHRIRIEKVSEEELAVAKAKISGNFVRSLERSSTQASQALSIKTDELPQDFYKNYLKRIDEVSVEDIQRVAQQYFVPEKARIVVVGSGKEVLEPLEKLTYNGVDLPVKYFDKTGNPVERPEYNKAIPASVTVQSIYDHYIEALGGKEAMAAIKTLYVRYKGSAMGQEMTLIQKQTDEGKLNTTIEMAGMTVQKQVFDGEKGYVEVQGQRQEIAGEEAEDLKMQAQLFPELVASELAELEGIEKVGEEEAYAVKTTEKQTDYYSVESGLKIQTLNQTPMGESTVFYTDYKAVNGVLFPFELAQSFGPQSIKFLIEDIKVNEGVSESDFQ